MFTYLVFFKASLRDDSTQNGGGKGPVNLLPGPVPLPVGQPGVQGPMGPTGPIGVYVRAELVY